MGVSLTSVVSKILQPIIHSHIMKHLGTYNILVDNQHGFRAKHSTVTQLVLTIRDLTLKPQTSDTGQCGEHQGVIDQPGNDM